MRRLCQGFVWPRRGARVEVLSKTTGMSSTPLQSTGEEIANSIIHGAGLAASLVALPVAVAFAAAFHGSWQVVGNAVFGASLVALYATSTLYHAIPHPRAKRVLRVCDHSAIYLLIAGTYTPFSLGVLRGGWGWSLLVVVWALAAAGILFKVRWGFRFGVASTLVYLLMGWLCLVAIRPMVTLVPTAGLAWMVTGGVFYSSGVAFYAWKSLRFSHAVWHVFVLLGSVCHYVAVLWYSA